MNQQMICRLCVLLLMVSLSACQVGVEIPVSPPPEKPVITAPVEVVPVDTPPSAEQPVSSDEQPVSPDEQPLGVIVEDGMGGQAEKVYVDSLDVLILESFPVQVNVTVKGSLPDSCTTITSSKAEKLDGNIFQLHIYTERPEGLMCAQMLTPFEESIPLEVNGLPAGTYTVTGFGLQKDFTLDVDNSL